ncbi:MAG TPA: metallophosphoesterase [Nitrospiraceae bacterium]|nr:metallophosphoesterase [Nitrospiraceae bacterium]
MINLALRWYDRARLLFAHGVGLPLHHVYNLLPYLEFGLSSVEISRIECQHPPLAGRRAVHITDLHLDRYQPRHDSALETIANLKPDWIFVTGDLLNVPDGLPHLFRFLSSLRDLAPVYVTLGNHDHYSGVPIHRFSEMADRHKITLLINQAAFVSVNSGELGIIGVDDPSLHRADLRCIPPRATGRFTVLLAHAPNVLDHLDDTHAIDLVLCGHSHGGQWRIPLIRPFWLPYGCSGRVSGFHHKKGHRLYVNRGLGWSGLPLRFNCPQEILMIDWTDAKRSE